MAAEKRTTMQMTEMQAVRAMDIRGAQKMTDDQKLKLFMSIFHPGRDIK